ncbi:MAG: CvpA family protein [Marinomonas sp.]|jgi:membrane protein required for colicin V production|uniref:CvpA family protein n=1 Tax=Marinomonas sp. S3726 TaxID=579484 RepID=UPI0005F9BD57|nr:CvpA family protein [Marinomonas sp. S3726]KJZ13932.1 colicin V production CvpA [Marinomonas sp. S3726]
MDQISSIATLDWVVFAVITLSTLLSLKRGFIKEVLSLITWVLAFVIAVKFSSQMQSLIVDQVQNDQIRYIVAFASLFVASLCVGALINFLLGSLIKITGLSSTDRVLGMLFGFARGTLILVAFTSLLSLSPVVTETDFWKDSKLVPKLVVLKDWARDVLGKGSDYIDPSLIERALGS